jgi:hypothetical protein
MVIILEKGLLRAAICWPVQWGSSESHLVVRIEIVDRVQGWGHPRLRELKAVQSHNVVCKGRY